jgi:tetratricopeptide (TPR) repeat protein
VRRDLRGLSKEGADWVAAHLVAAGALADEEPELAWRHARAARARGGRIGVVRETVGLVAYRAGEWAEAIGELRAARRMGGGPGHLAVMADCERALGHPERAIELSRSTEADGLDPEAAIELQIVVAGARADLGQVDAALAQIQRLGLDKAEGQARLAYAYADLLLKAGRRDEAVSWFIRSANADLEEETDALERLEELGAAEDVEEVLASTGEPHDEPSAAPGAEVDVEIERSSASVAEPADEHGRQPDAPPDTDSDVDQGSPAAAEPADDAPAEALAFTDVTAVPAGPAGPGIDTGVDTASPAVSDPAAATPAATEPTPGHGAAAEPSSADDTDQAPVIVPTVLFSDDPTTGDR